MTDKEIARIYREMELMLIDSMKRNLGLHLAEEAETGLDYPQWQAIKLRELRKYQEQNSEIISGKLNRLPEEVAKQLRDELNQGYESEITRFRSVIGKGRYKEAVAMSDSFFKINTRKVDALIEEVNGSLYKANHAALRMANDVYRDVIFKTGMFVSNGAMTEQQAYDMAMKDFLNRGLNCIEYKDGRRVNIADYTSMAVRTANQRAYMMGEGEFRKEIGNPLVIISRHNTSCELCAPFQNKVLIDDVYSGGTQDDGDYMLMSEAMDKGLFHPRCRHGLSTYYPEIDEIDREYDDYTEHDITDYGEHNQAYAENMIQKYKRLSHGSLDPKNVSKYEAKLREWEGKASVNKSLMASNDNSSNDWVDAPPRNVSKEEKEEIVKYAKSKGINIVDISGFDGDSSLLKSEIDTLSILKRDFGIEKQKITVRVSNSLDDSDFASTTNKTITFNRKVLRNRKITERNIGQPEGAFASKRVEDIAAHEFGHIISSLKGNKGIEISQKAYYNIYNKDLSIDEVLEYLNNEISQYSIEIYEKAGRGNKAFNVKDFKEVISEVLAKNNSSANPFTKEFVRLLKEV